MFDLRMRVYLAGFMGSGKSTVGPLVADALGVDFVDLDDVVEARAGQSIPTIFSEHGEAAFRQLEADALRATADRSDAVIALGGGTIADDANREFARSHGRLIYLKVSADTVVERVVEGAAHRPLLQDDTGTPLPIDRMHARIERLLAARRSAYEAAPITVDANRPPGAVARAIVEAVQGTTPEEGEDTS
jgi:shikimate kinase